MLIMCLAAWPVSQPVACRATNVSCCEASLTWFWTFITLLARNSSSIDITNFWEAPVKEGLIAAALEEAWCAYITVSFICGKRFLAVDGEGQLKPGWCARVGVNCIRSGFTGRAELVWPWAKPFIIGFMGDQAGGGGLYIGGCFGLPKVNVCSCLGPDLGRVCPWRILDWGLAVKEKLSMV